MIRVRIDLAYDGGGFHGFARQPHQRTVQGVLEGALERVCGTSVRTTVAGRTDAGVHAERQVVHVDLPDDDRVRARLERPDAFARALDRMCGPEVTVWSARPARPTFDARFDADRRRYRYLLCDADAMDPRWRHTVWHVGGPALDVAAMRRGGTQLLGEHDFSSFCRRSGDQHLRRRVDVLDFDRLRTPDWAGSAGSSAGDDVGGFVAVRVEGPAFCHQMVRSIVGCLLRVGRGTRHPDEVADILAARDRAAVGQVAPPHGLTLIGVDYPAD